MTKKTEVTTPDPDKITIYIGTEKISPVQYNSFEVGGHHYTTTIQPGETPEEAWDRAYAFLMKKHRETFQERASEFLDNLIKTRAIAKSKAKK